MEDSFFLLLSYSFWWTFFRPSYHGLICRRSVWRMRYLAWLAGFFLGLFLFFYFTVSLTKINATERGPTAVIIHSVQGWYNSVRRHFCPILLLLRLRLLLLLLLSILFSLPLTFRLFFSLSLLFSFLFWGRFYAFLPRPAGLLLFSFFFIWFFYFFFYFFWSSPLSHLVTEGQKWSRRSRKSMDVAIAAPTRKIQPTHTHTHTWTLEGAKKKRSFGCFW